MNESLKCKVERAIGDQFVEWLNRATGTAFQFARTGADPPDLVYRDGNKTLPVEVATSYYHEEDAIMLWKHARKDCTAPMKWSKPVDEPDQRLITDINQRIVEKCGIEIPNSIPFAAIYIAGRFPHGDDGSSGYSCWKVS